MDLINSKNETITSREIAVLAGKTHDNVLKSIRKMEDAWIQINGVKFNVVDYIDGKGEKRVEYQLNKKESLYIVTKYNDYARLKVINRWEELEKQAVNNQFQIPTTLSSALLLASQQAEQIEQQQLQLEQTNNQLQAVSTKVNEQAIELRNNQSKVTFANAVMESADSCLIGHLASLISQTGYKIGQNKLFQLLRDLGYLGVRGDKYNKPLQHAIESGLFELKYSEYLNNEGAKKLTTVTKVTAKGQEFFINLFKI